MFRIRDWLYVSGYPVASNKATVKKQNIEAMLQLFQRIKISGVDTLFLNIEDGQPIGENEIRQGVDYVLNHHKKGKRVLITCGAGISRSVTFATAVLKEAEGLSLEAAYRDIRTHHKEALPDHIHWDSLRKYYDDGPEFWEIWQSVMLDDDDDF